MIAWMALTLFDRVKTYDNLGVGWAKARSPTSFGRPFVGPSYRQPNLRAVVVK